MSDDYVFLHDLIYRSGKPNYVGLKVPILSNWNIDFLERELVHYDDNDICRFLKYGFPIGYAKQDLPISNSRNHKGVELYPESVDKFIETELSYNALLGPFSGNPLCCSLAVSPLNTVEKDETSRRVIVDLS